MPEWIKPILAEYLNRQQEYDALKPWAKVIQKPDKSQTAVPISVSESEEETMNHADRFSRPFRFGGGYVVDEQRDEGAFRSHIMRTKKEALAYRAKAIREAESAQ